MKKGPIGMKIKIMLTTCKIVNLPCRPCFKNACTTLPASERQILVSSVAHFSMLKYALEFDVTKGGQNAIRLSATKGVSSQNYTMYSKT